MFTHFTIVRHGETDANLNEVIQGQTDIPLNAAGIKQAEFLAARWKNKSFDAVYSSDLSRASTTAKVIMPDHKAIESSVLREMDLGDWCGRTVSEIAASDPEEWQAFRCGDMDCQAPGGESRRDVFARVEKFFIETAKKHAGKEVLVVTHGGILRAFFILVMGGADANIKILPATGNTGITTAKLNLENMQWRLITWNDTAHLEHLLSGDDAY